MKSSYIYILTNKYRTTFYIGVTTNLKQRIEEHQLKKGSNFASKYNLKFLDVNQAIKREKQLKNWKKEWKLNLIKQINPNLEAIRL